MEDPKIENLKLINEFLQNSENKEETVNQPKDNYFLSALEKLNTPQLVPEQEFNHSSFDEFISNWKEYFEKSFSTSYENLKGKIIQLSLMWINIIERLI